MPVRLGVAATTAAGVADRIGSGGGPGPHGAGPATVVRTRCRNRRHGVGARESLEGTFTTSTLHALDGTQGADVAHPGFRPTAPPGRPRTSALPTAVTTRAVVPRAERLEPVQVPAAVRGKRGEQVNRGGSAGTLLERHRMDRHHADLQERRDSAVRPHAGTASTATPSPSTSTASTSPCAAKACPANKPDSRHTSTRTDSPWPASANASPSTPAPSAPRSWLKASAPATPKATHAEQPASPTGDTCDRMLGARNGWVARSTEEGRCTATRGRGRCRRRRRRWGSRVPRWPAQR